MKHGHFCTPVHTDLNYRHLPFRQITKQNASFPLCNYLFLPVPMTTRSKAWVCSHSSAEIVGSNPSRGKDVRLLCVLCVVRHSSLRRADHSSRGFLPSVVRDCVRSRNLNDEETMARVVPQHHRGEKMSISPIRLTQDLHHHT